MGDDCKTVHLLAERQGGGNGRVYKVELALVDAHGNICYETIIAEISHDQSKKKSVKDDGPSYVVNGCDIEMQEEMVDNNENTGDDELTNENSNSDDNLTEENSDSDDEMSSIFNEDSLETYPNPYQNSFSINFKPSMNDVISIEPYNTAILLESK